MTYINHRVYNNHYNLYNIQSNQSNKKIEVMIIPGYYLVRKN